MPTSDNGWSVTTRQSDLVNVYPRGTRVPFRVRRGTEIVWQPLLDALQRIEPVQEAGWDGGYAYRKTRGSDTSWSTHSSGTGGDWNASQHPRGKRGTWSPAQRAAIRAFLKTPAGRAFKWGADFSTIPDEMHFQLRNPAVVAAVKLTLRIKPKPKPKPPVPTPVKPAVQQIEIKEVDMILYSTGRSQPAFAVLGSSLRRFSAAEVTTLRAQGMTVAFLTVSATDPVWKLPVL